MKIILTLPINLIKLTVYNCILRICLECNSYFSTCQQDDVCASLLINTISCLETNSFHKQNLQLYLDLIIDPKAYQQEYFHTSFNNYWSKLATCYPTSSNSKYTQLSQCV